MKRALLVACAAWSVSGQAATNAIADACRTDLDALPAFLLENDTGAPAHVERLGQDVFDRAWAKARDDASRVEDEDACLSVLRTYLRTYRRGHLGVSFVDPDAARTLSPPPTANDARAPRFRVLSKRTALLVLPSFGDPYAALIASTVATHRAEILARPNLVVDVRHNGGGSDSSYEPVMPFIDDNITRTVSAEFLSTPANIAASEDACRNAGNEAAICWKFMTPVLDAMRAAPAGTYVRVAGDNGTEVARPGRTTRNPRRIGLLIDRLCGSSCEEFVLAARQSLKVKVFGRPTYGALDYSNLRPHMLPSGRHRLTYATSRSLRLPAFPVDVAGLQPDQFLPQPADGDTAAYDAEVDQVRAVLESAHAR